MATYRVDTEGGSYNVETEDASPVTRKEDIPQVPKSPFSSQLQPNYEGMMGAKEALMKPMLPSEKILSTPAGQMASSAVGTVSGGGLGPFMGALMPPQQREQAGANLMAEQTSPLGVATMFLPLGKGVVAETAVPRNEIAGGVINSLIKPRDVEFRYHNNPGMVVAKEGLWAPNAKSLLGQINSRIGEIHNSISNVRSGLDHADKTIDLTDSMTPIAEQFTKFAQKPETNAPYIEKLTKNENDLKSFLSKENFDPKRVTPEQAYKIKDFVDDFIDWGKTEKSDVDINKAFKEIYSNIDKSLDEAIPDLKTHNERIRGLYDARKALNRRLLAEQRRGLEQMHLPTGVAGILGGILGQAPGAAAGVLASEVARSTAFKTGLAKLLADKYPAMAKVPTKALAIK